MWSPFLDWWPCSSCRSAASVPEHAGPIDLVAQRLELLLGRRLHRLDLLGCLHLEASVGLDVFHGHAGEHLSETRLQRVGVEVEDALRRHDPLRTAAVELVLAAHLLAGMGD